MRPRLTSLRVIGLGGVKPRFGRRRCSGIWPPSKPLMRTPERAVWPLPPRPDCLPLPEPMPRPTRMRALDEPGLSLISLSFMARSSLTLDHANEMRDLGDHAAIGRRVGDARPAADPVEAEAFQGFALRSGPPNGAAGLLDRNGFLTAHVGWASRIGGVGFDALAARLQGRHLEVAALRNRPRAVFARKRVEGGPDHVVGVRRALAFGDDVMHAKGLEHRAHRTTGDDPRSRGGGAQHHAAGAVAAVDVMMQRPAFAQRYAKDAALGGFRRLANRFRHFARLAMAEADAAFLVADDDECGEAEAPPTLHHL